MRYRIMYGNTLFEIAMLFQQINKMSLTKKPHPAFYKHLVACYDLRHRYLYGIAITKSSSLDSRKHYCATPFIIGA